MPASCEAVSRHLIERLTIDDCEGSSFDLYQMSRDIIVIVISASDSHVISTPASRCVTFSRTKGLTLQTVISVRRSG